MRQFELGPNGAIMTCLNLFAAKFHQVIQLIEKRKLELQESGQELDFVVVDSPGQMEVFTWSSSGSIITSLLSHSFPTLVLYTLDGALSSHNPITFLSNMLHCSSG